VTPGVLLGLSETGTRVDVPLVKEFVDHKRSRIRASALSGLHRLGAEDAVFYIRGLQDGSARVRNTCVAILKSNYGHVRPDLETLLKNGTIKTQMASLTVLRHYEVLDSLRDILFSLASPHEELQEMAWRYLTSWHQRNQAKLWFRVQDATFKETVALLDRLRKAKSNPPRYARSAWEDLPNILRTITAQN